MSPTLILVLVALLAVVMAVWPLIRTFLNAAIRRDELDEALEDGVEALFEGCGARIGAFLGLIGIGALAWLGWIYWPR